MSKSVDWLHEVKQAEPEETNMKKRFGISGFICQNIAKK